MATPRLPSSIRVACALVSPFVSLGALAAEGEAVPTTGRDPVVAVKSRHDLEETESRLRKALTAKGLSVAFRLDHERNAQKAGLSLQPTRLFLFGNPKAGTPLMQDDQRVGLELPMRILLWQDGNKEVWVGYLDPRSLQTRYELKGKAKALETMSKVLDGLAREASGGP